MNTQKPHYNPWDRTEAEDVQVQKALDDASANQLAGLVDELLEKADAEAKEDSE